MKHRIAVSLLVLAVASLALVAFASARTAAASDTTSVTVQHGASGAQPQQQSDDTDGQRVDVMLWTLLASSLALALGLIAFAVRVIMGWVKPPPAPEDVHH